MKEKTVYLCEKCGRLYRTEEACKRHEGKCYYWLDANACITCANLVLQMQDDIYAVDGIFMHKDTHYCLLCLKKEGEYPHGLVHDCEMWEERGDLSGKNWKKYGKTIVEVIE